jgi:structural maintenance of chromosomes protein 5
MIKGIALTNFMSYENAYVPLGSGLNLICGPNGAGKSSILLAISVVLGQTYTERARRLSDLIRWRADEARITLQLDNRSREHGKPFPQYHVDTVTVTRILKRNGSYQYLVQDHPVTKNEVTNALARYGLNPDNILVIMHQLMVGRFASISPNDKLKMLEEAVGFQSYRSNVLEAQERLTRAAGEEESLAQVLESTKETHEYWRREHERFLQKKALDGKLAELKREMAWGRIQKREEALLRIQERVESRARMIESADQKLLEADESLKRRQERYDRHLKERFELHETYIELVRQEAAGSSSVEWVQRFTEETQKRLFQPVSTENPEQSNAQAQVPDRNEGIPAAMREWLDALGHIRAETEEKLGRTRERLKTKETALQDLDARTESELSHLIDAKVDTQVLGFKRKLLSEQLADLEAQRKMLEEEIEPLRVNAEQMGPRFENPRKLSDIILDIGAVEEQLRPLAHLSEDVEKMYSSYANMYEDLRGKAEQLARNRQEVITEVEKRLGRWRDVVSTFLHSLEARYNEILREVGATGELKLNVRRNVEQAGLDILVGFKGAPPTRLDSLTQSGGERSIALMAFLLALQHHIASPFRAIDEFDVHLDPKNREVISRLIVASARELGETQYVAITPGQVTVPDTDVHVVVVQNIEGSSVISQVK